MYVVSTLESRLYALGKTKSSLKCHVVQFGRTSWCNHELVSEVRTEVTYRDLFGWDICTGCYRALTFADARETG